MSIDTLERSPLATTDVLEHLRRRLDETGTAIFPPNVVFGPDELERLDALQSTLPEEHVLIGDAGEPNMVHVRRVMIDLAGEKPRRVNTPVSEEILAILDDETRRAFFADLLGGEKHLRRCQINRMTRDSFIGLHVDRDSNPDYEVAVVIQLGRAFEGGEFVVHPAGDTPVVVRPEYGSVVVSRCEIPHEVLRVKSEERTSLVFFLSDHDGANRRVLA